MERENSIINIKTIVIQLRPWGGGKKESWWRDKRTKLNKHWKEWKKQRQHSKEEGSICVCLCRFRIYNAIPTLLGLEWEQHNWEKGKGNVSEDPKIVEIWRRSKREKKSLIENTYFMSCMYLPNEARIRTRHGHWHADITNNLKKSHNPV